MDGEHGLQPKAVGSISRLPILPRASRDSLRPTAPASKDGSLKSNLPRLSNRYGPSKIIPPAPLGDRNNRSIVDQSIRSRNRSPVRDALQAAQATALETTPPGSIGDAPVFNENNENPAELEKQPQKRRPRPSLTERTLETLSQIPSSPSPTRRRASIASNGRQMDPPARPAPSLRGSRPTTPSGSRPSSPTKQTFKPPGRASPTRHTPLPAVPSPGSLFSPPQALVKGGSVRLARTPVEDQRSISTSVESGRKTNRTPLTYSAKTMRLKPSSHEAAHKALESVFKDPGKPTLPSTRLAVDGSSGSSGLLRARSIGENTIAASPARARNERNKANSSKPMSAAADSSASKSGTPQPLKSSAALRETIAKAKAARRSAASSIKTATDFNDISTFAPRESLNNDLDIIDSNEGHLKQRIKSGAASGVLTISAMRLNAVPDDVMRMYESNDVSGSWAEMVDLTRFNAADNMIDRIQDEIFPDWSTAEMAKDEEKSNQFGGLEGLDLHNNLLQELPVGLRRLERLASLNLSGNKLSNQCLNVIWQIPNLQELNLSRNALSGKISLEAGILQTLRVLSMRENKIEEIELAGSECSLRTFDLSDNSIGQLPWKAIAKWPIVELNISGNGLVGVAFDGVSDGFHQLREMDLSRNAFVSLAACVSDFSELELCRLSNNRLSALPDLSNCRSLVILQVSENQLSELPLGFDTLDKLRSADFSQNDIKVLDPEIAKMETLTSLELAGNPLRDRKFLTMETTEIKLELHKRLASEDGVEGGAHGSTPGDFPSQVNPGSSGYHFLFKPSNGMLDMASKGLTEIDIGMIDLESASPPVHTLRLSNNDLTSLPYELLSHPAVKWTLKSLDISHNPQLHPTTYLADDLFLPMLQSLYIVSTGLSSLDALTSHLKAPALTELNISCHRLTGHLPWIRAWFPSCTSLLATDNWFSSVDVEAVRGLEVVDIRNNEIESLPALIGMLGNHAGKMEPGRLRVFECAGNRFRVPRITVIEKGTEAALRDLRRMVPESEVIEEWKDEI